MLKYSDLRGHFEVTGPWQQFTTDFSFAKEEIPLLVILQMCYNQFQDVIEILSDFADRRLE
ncbi:MAG: hypothetical protein LUG61_00490 [Lachnospiraceae bacterium]|nr:hypothetical protein [Lachnospiraceae bacterium]